MKIDDKKDRLLRILSPHVGIHGVKVYEIDNNNIRKSLSCLKKLVAIENKSLEPYIDDEYICDTCGTIGTENPISGYCFICDTDNWRLINNY